MAAIFATAYLSIASWVLANWQFRATSFRWARLFWSIACLANVAHVMLAFHFLHGWSHSAAADAITQQVYDQVGFAWEGGIYVNYGFCALWLVDAAIWWIAPARYERRSPWLSGLVQFIVLFMFFNATVVFGKSDFRVVGGLLCLAGVMGWLFNSWREPAALANDPPAEPLEVDAPREAKGRSWLYYGWINLLLAALAMTATLPGRSHGLSLITKYVTSDPSLGVSESYLAVLNFWAVILGSALCLPVGRLIDRWGVRSVLVAVSLGLGYAVLEMSSAVSVLGLFVTLTLVRGLGQGALSVVSMALIGKWFTRQLPIAMAVFTVLLTIGFLIGNFAVGIPVEQYGWRPAWWGVGIFLLVVLAPLGALFARSTPESIGLTVERVDPVSDSQGQLDLPLGSALRSAGFWAFTLAVSLFNLTWSAITFYNQSILESQGFNRATFLMVMGVLVLSGLPANLCCGWLAQRWPMGRLMCAGMLLLAGSLAAFPHLTTNLEAGIYAAALGVSGGIITVIFFSVYGHAFGRRHLGAIQATVQIATVFASAAGPELLIWSRDESHALGPFFYSTASLAVVLGIACWLAPLPRATRSG